MSLVAVAGALVVALATNGCAAGEDNTDVTVANDTTLPNCPTDEGDKQQQTRETAGPTTGVIGSSPAVGSTPQPTQDGTSQPVVADPSSSNGSARGTPTPAPSDNPCVTTPTTAPGNATNG